MGALHIAGFEIPVARGSGQRTTGQQGAPTRALDGSPGGGIFEDVEDASFNTPIISLAEARAIDNLCRGSNGARWSCDDTVYSTNGMEFIDTPTFQAGTVQFGTHAIQINASGGDLDVYTVTSATLNKYTVAAWTNINGAGWNHHILRSDGAKWVNAVRNDVATLKIDVVANVFTLLDDGSIMYFDDVVWLPFEIDDDWGADWPQLEAFSNLPDLEVWGDLFGEHQFTARCRSNIQHTGRRVKDGTTEDAAIVQLQITGGERIYRA